MNGRLEAWTRRNTDWDVPSACLRDPSGTLPCQYPTKICLQNISYLKYILVVYRRVDPFVINGLEVSTHRVVEPDPARHPISR